tara:strand:+ start:176 stop:850 length:675 start_codon:yes stop_codon:yes gene_type:complete
MINIKDKKLILLPPKTGTISFESFFKNEFCGYAPYSRKSRTKHVHMYLFEAIKCYRIKDIQNWQIYQTARNPMDRIVSAFLHQKRIMKKNGRDVDRIKFESFVENLNLHHRLLPEKERAFASAVFLRDVAITRRKQRKNSAGVRFYVPQTTWANPNQFNVQYIKLGENNSKLYADMGLPEDLELPQLNRGGLDKSSYTDMHTDKTKEIVRSLYKEDFLKINYEQ